LVCCRALVVNDRWHGQITFTPNISHVAADSSYARSYSQHFRRATTKASAARSRDVTRYLGQLVRAVGTPTPQDQKITPSHHLDSALHDLSHSLQHLKRLADPSVQGEKGRRRVQCPPCPLPCGPGAGVAPQAGDAPSEGADRPVGDQTADGGAGGVAQAEPASEVDDGRHREGSPVAALEPPRPLEGAAQGGGLRALRRCLRGPSMSIFR
jgi:hypothetical protein